MVPHFFSKRTFFPLLVACLLLMACGDTKQVNTNVQTTGTQPDIAIEIEAVDGSIVSVSGFNGTPTAMWFWSPN